MASMFERISNQRRIEIIVASYWYYTNEKDENVEFF